MNNTRRREIAKASGLLSEALAILQAAQEEEQEYLDNMPESFRDGEKGQMAEAAVDALDEAVSEVEAAIGSIEQAGE